MTNKERELNKKTEHLIGNLESLKSHIKKLYKAEIVGIFGSYVRGEQKESSDLDVLVKFCEDASLFNLTGLAHFLEEKLSVMVDIVPVDTLRKEIKDHVLKEAVYL
ncbi:MAG: nucleotidyltransferase family protein [Candidatus Aminicenantes bacterium]|jgi:predicted nucleotidyltransferase